MRRNIGFVIVMVCVMSFSVAFGDAVIGTSVQSGDPYSDDSTFYVDVAVTSNDTGQAPACYAFRCTYDGDQVSLTGASDVSFGASPSLGSVEGSGTSTFRDISTSGNFDQSALTLTMFRMTFVTGTLTGSYDISMSDDPDSSNPFFDSSMAAIAHSFDNTGTQSMPVEMDWMIVE